MIRQRFFKYFFLLLMISPFANAGVHDVFNKAKEDPNALYALLKAMPKGGELHYHLAGGAYPEIMLKLAMSSSFCLNTENFSIEPSSENCNGIPTQELSKHPDIYEKTLRAWSMKDFKGLNETGHDHFFETFYKFMPIFSNYPVELLVDVMKRAASQHELYMEIMLIPGPRPLPSKSINALDKASLTQIKNELLKDPRFIENVEQIAKNADSLKEKAYAHFNCDKNPEKEVCKLEIAFQYHVLREFPLEQVFSEALLAFETVLKSPSLVAVNLVQPEDGMISLKDYHRQMEIFNFLHEIYPTVPIALHAGELAPAAVTPEVLSFHIKDAIETGHAKRIGHGVDVAYEKNAISLLQKMAKEKIAVEINLSSNEAILGIKKKEHPLKLYLAYHVPVVLSTDDEGILRTDLTREYVKAVREHDISYETLKQINRNALSYSFLEGNSLWQDPEKAILVPECQKLESSSCLRYIEKNKKAKIQRMLELSLIEFEKRIGH